MTGRPAYPPDWAAIMAGLEQRIRDAYTAATSRRIVPPPHVRKTVDGPPATNTTTLAADPQLSLPVEAVGVYRVELLLIYAADPAADLKTGWTLPTGSVLTWWRTGLNAGGTVDTPALTASDTAALAGVTSATTKQAAQLGGLLIVGGTGGQLTLLTAQQSAHASDATVYAPSTLLLTRLE